MSIRNKIIANLEERLFRSSLISKIDGVNIVNLRHEDDGFKEIVTLSLELLKKYDTKRYRRVINEILWIVNTYQVHECCPEYYQRTKAGYIKFKRFNDDLVYVSLYYAGIIINSATLGWLINKDIKCTKNNILQIHRICTIEQNRFYSNIEKEYPEYSGSMVHEFNPEEWQYSHNKSKIRVFLKKLARVMRN